MQPLTLMGVVTGLNENEVSEYITNVGPEGAMKAFDNLKYKLASYDVHPSYKAPVLFKIYRDLFAIMWNHEYETSGLDAALLTKSSIQGRKELNDIVNKLRQTDGVFKNIRLVCTSPYICVRDGRRIDGLYTVTTDDLVNGVRHEDAVCRATFAVDIHPSKAGQGDSFSDGGIKAKPYDIPFRALVSKDVDNLFMAGRCISGDFYAHASYRMTGNASAMGEAAGKAASKYGKE